MSETEWESDPSFNCEPSKHSDEDIRVAIQAYQLCRSRLKILDTLPIFYVYILWLADAYIALLDSGYIIDGDILYTIKRLRRLLCKSRYLINLELGDNRYAIDLTREIDKAINPKGGAK